MSVEVFAVTGASGILGGAVARRLAATGARQRLVVRDPARAPRLPRATPVVAAGYGDVHGMREALTGATTLLLVSARESADRVTEQRCAVDAAVAAGVQRIVYTSSVGAAPDAVSSLARDHWRTEEYVLGSGLRSVLLRNSLYLDVLPRLVADDGVIRGPAGTGAVAAVSRFDVADVLTTVLLDGPEHDGAAYDVTGREALTLAEVAEQLSTATGRQVRYEPETVTAAYAARERSGTPGFAVESWVSSYAAIAAGELAAVSDTVPRLSGHPAQTLEEWLARPAA